MQPGRFFSEPSQPFFKNDYGGVVHRGFPRMLTNRGTEKAATLGTISGVCVRVWKPISCGEMSQVQRVPGFLLRQPR